jgi:hypothetical protein
MMYEETAVSQVFLQMQRGSYFEELHQQPLPGKGDCRREATGDKLEQEQAETVSGSLRNTHLKKTCVSLKKQFTHTAGQSVQRVKSQNITPKRYGINPSKVPTQNIDNDKARAKNRECTNGKHL